MTPSPDSPDAAAAPVPLGALAERMGIALVEARPERVVLTMPVDGNTQPFGLLHGGANAVLVETAGSIGSAIHAGPGHAVVGLDINVTHHRSAREGTVTATAVPLTLGRTITSYEVTVADDAGRLLCTGRLTCLVRAVSDSGKSPVTGKA